MRRRVSFSHKHFILCEGEEDAAFVRSVVRERNPGLSFDVSPNIDIGGVGGNSGFGRSILALEPMTGFTEVRSVIILADNDEDPERSFALTVRDIASLKNENKIQRSWGEPEKPGLRFDGNPAVTVWMWPEPGRVGCLETLLWDMIVDKHPIEAACVEDACKCSGADNWPVSKYHKARVRSFLALVCRGNPAISLSMIWRDYPEIISASHHAFEPFSDFLSQIYQ